jgi:hypothetical protein
MGHDSFAGMIPCDTTTKVWCCRGFAGTHGSALGYGVKIDDVKVATRRETKQLSQIVSQTSIRFRATTEGHSLNLLSTITGSTKTSLRISLQRGSYYFCRTSAVSHLSQSRGLAWGVTAMLARSVRRLRQKSDAVRGWLDGFVRLRL